MPKDDKVYLTHMLELGGACRDKVRGVTRTQFELIGNLILVTDTARYYPPHTPPSTA